MNRDALKNVIVFRVERITGEVCVNPAIYAILEKKKTQIAAV